MTSAHTKTANYTVRGFIIMRFISVTLIFHVQAPLWSKLNKDLYMRTNKKTGFLHYSGRPKPKTVARVRLRGC